MPTKETRFELLKRDVLELAKDAKDFITKIEFEGRIKPLEKIVYGIVSATLLAVLAGALRFFIK